MKFNVIIIILTVINIAIFTHNVINRNDHKHKHKSYQSLMLDMQKNGKLNYELQLTIWAMDNDVYIDFNHIDSAYIEAIKIDNKYILE